MLGRGGVVRPFVEKVDSGKSSFNVVVPRSYCTDFKRDVSGNEKVRHREFFFSELNIVPGYFSRKAFELGVEADAEDRKAGGPTEEYLLKYSVIARSALYFDLQSSSRQEKFQRTRRETKTDDTVRVINSFFEDSKPPDINSTPFFIDWIDVSWMKEDTIVKVEKSEAEEDMDTTVFYDPNDVFDEQVPPEPVASTSAGTKEAGKEEKKKEEVKKAAVSKDLVQGTKEFFEFYVDSNAEIYYDEPYNESTHHNALPESAKKLPGVNNFKLPSDLDEIETVRLRIHIAPMTLVHFSSNTLLEDLGFTADNYGGKEGRRYHLNNSGVSGYLTVVAKNVPRETIQAMPVTFFCTRVMEYYYSPYIKVVINEEEFKSNAKVLAQVQNALKDLNKKTNLTVSLKYTENEKKFKFTLPNKRLVVSVHCDSRLADRLGYGPVSVIAHGTDPMAAVEKDSKIDADALSRALVWDTGMAIVTMDSSSAINTIGLSGQLMATLLPKDPPGILQMNFNSQDEEAAARAPSTVSSQEMVPLKFNIYTMGKNSSVVPLQWPVNCYVGGVLRGRLEVA